MAEPKDRAGDQAPPECTPPSQGRSGADLAALIQAWYRRARAEAEQHERERRHTPHPSPSANNDRV
jgi:hypothetical protein